MIEFKNVINIARVKKSSPLHFSPIILNKLTRLGSKFTKLWSKFTVCHHKSSCTRPFMWSTGPMFKRNNQATFATMQGLYVLLGSSCSFEHTTACRTPCLPGCTGTASHGRYDCTQFIIRYHLLYSNLIPSHPVPQPSRALSARCGPYSILEDCPFYSRHPFP